MNDHEARLREEVSWYTNPQRTHLLNRWPFYSQKRNDTSYHVAKRRLFAKAVKLLPKPSRILVAPCGSCADYPFIRSAWPNAELIGLDIAPYSGPEKTYVGDILEIPFADGEFDLAISNLFFHHVADEGFAPYLKELRRVAPSMLTLEPSRLHPISLLVTRPAMKLFGNITSQVPHEHPISIPRLADECLTAGYSNVETYACSFAHNRVPIPIRPLVNALCAIPAVKNYAWLLGLVAT